MGEPKDWTWLDGTRSADDFLSKLRESSTRWPSIFASEYQNELPPPPTPEQLREFVRTEDSARVRIGSVLADCPETVERAFLFIDRRGRLATDAMPEVLGIPVVYDRYARPGTIALLDRSGRPLLVVDIPEEPRG